MNNYKGILHVSNLVQKYLYKNELSGQISDGCWENAKPNNHWIITSDLNVICSDKTGIQTDHRILKDNYNFTAPDLLDAIGDRMINIGKVVTSNLFTEPEIEILLNNYINECENINEVIEKLNRYKSIPTDKYYMDRYNAVMSIPNVIEKLTTAFTNSYNIKSLKSDLTDLKSAFRNRIYE